LQSACARLACGPGAVCVARNHVGKCSCPSGGLFKGDPYRDGCKEVRCLENADCALDEYCDRLSYTCLTVCQEGLCDNTATCTAVDHKHLCQCPPGTVPDPTPEQGCKVHRRHRAEMSRRSMSATMHNNCSMPQRPNLPARCLPRRLLQGRRM
jgi:hypothetical protein